MTNQSQFDVMVVGGGPAGMSTAMACAHFGLTTALIAPPAPARDFRTTALMMGSVTMLEELGLWEHIAPFTSALKIMQIADDTKRLIRAPFTAFDSAEINQPAFGYNMPNEKLNAALASQISRFEHLTLFTEKAAAIEPREDAVSVRLEDGTRLDGQVLAGADGRNSPSRAAAGIETRSWVYPQSALILNFRHTLPHHNRSTEFHTPTGPFTMVPLGQNRSSLVCVEAPAVAEQLHAMSDDALSAEVERRGHSVLGKVTVETERQIYPMSGMTPKKFGANRIALVGESAHIFPPIGAQGLNLGLRDAAALVDALIDARKAGIDLGSPSVMRAYDKNRQIDVVSRTKAVDLLNRSLLSGFLPVQGLRGAGMYLLGSVAPLRRMLMKEGIAPAYRLPRLMQGSKQVSRA